MSQGLALVTSAEGPRTVDAYLVDPDTTVRHATIGVLPGGYGTVPAMLATTRPFYLAHRGGSADWPEMTLRAYTNSAAWGAGALEVSLARTLDGVWFGLHDQTLLRTSGVDVDPITMTWAQVASLEVFGAEPYMPWEQLADAYAPTHVLVVDPKYRQSTHRGEFLDMLDQAGGPARCVVKYAGGNTALADAAAERGYQRWGYYYPDELGLLAATQSAWSILGMTHAAPPEAWDTALAYGKPVIGHTIENPTHAADALAKGAAGLMVAGVTTVVPPALPWT
jgi:hypothetical protein